MAFVDHMRYRVRRSLFAGTSDSHDHVSPNCTIERLPPVRTTARDGAPGTRPLAGVQRVQPGSGYRPAGRTRHRRMRQLSVDPAARSTKIGGAHTEGTMDSLP